MTTQNPLILTVDEIHALTNYAHWIPITQGIADEFIKATYPGWEWNQLIPTLIDKNILIYGADRTGNRQLLQGLTIDCEVKEILYKTDAAGRLRIKVIRVGKVNGTFLEHGGEI